MTLYVWFLLMIFISFVWIIWFLYSPSKNNQINLNNSNAELGKIKQEELKQDLANNIIDIADFEQANIDITQTLAQELTAPEETNTLQKNSIQFFTIVFILLLIPIISISTYQTMSQVKDIALSSNGEMQEEKLSLNETISEIKLYLLDNSKDHLAWASLASVYLELNDFEEALVSYEKSYQLNSTNPVILSEYASALFFANNEQFNQKSLDLLKQALQIDPNLTFALYQIGLYAASNGDYYLARITWEKALTSVTKDSPDRRFIEDLLLQLEDLTGEKSQQGEQNDFSVIITVSIPEKIKSERQGDYLMAYLKTANGRPAPIAIQKIMLSEFSGQVTLTNKDSIMQIEPLSKFEKVVAVVRITKSGLANKQKEDIQVQSMAFNLEDNPAINLKVLN